MFARFFASAVIVPLLLCAPSPVWANDAPVKSVGKTIQPLNDVPVRMVSEEVNMYLISAVANVTCLFTLRNEGEPDTIEVGFPRGWEGDLRNFTARKAGAKEPYPVETLAQDPSYNEFSGGELPWWKVFRVPFDSTGQTVAVENTYFTSLRIAAGKYPSPTNDLSFTYIMKTGALWKGNMENALMTVHLVTIPFEQVTSISPEGYVRKGNSIVWNFRDFKPSEDIRITVMQDVPFERMEIARRILKTDPKNAYARYLLGSVHFSRRNMADAQTANTDEELRKAISLDPKLWDAHWLLTLNYIKANVAQKNLKEVKRLLAPILRENPEYRCTDRLVYYDEYASSDNPRDLLRNLEINGWK